MNFGPSISCNSDTSVESLRDEFLFADHRYRQEDYAQAWGGSSNLSGYGSTSFSDTSAYGYGGSGKYGKW